jgi:hypothetical protein
MAKAWRKVVWEQAVAKRSDAVTIFRRIWLKNASPFALVNNISVTDTRKGPGEMGVIQALVDTGVATVDAVRDLIRSGNMYQNSAMYSLICGGVESGKFKQNPRRDPATISDLLTVAHEAAIRSELWFGLEKPGYRHDPSLDHGRLRLEEWKLFCDLVYEDRTHNEKNATQARFGAVPGTAGSDDDDSDDGETIDPKYFTRTK